MAVKLIKDDGGSSDDVQNIEDATTPTDLNPKADKKLLRRLDLHVLPWLCLLYALSLFDRNSISTAKIVGLVDDLKLLGNHYSVALLSFFPTYILIELPANTLIRKFGPKRMLTCMILCWGTVAMCFGFVNTFTQLIALRVLLGIFEGGFNPACVYLISSWYKRYEVQQRIAIWYISGSFISGFSGIISYGLSNMEGVGGLRGWRWIFIIPGILTICMAVPIFLFVSDFPEKATWLRPDELERIKSRLDEDRGEKMEDKITRKVLIEVYSDWKLWVLSLLHFFITSGAYAMSFFTPSILRGFGYDVALSQILVTPPYVCAALCAVGSSILADRYCKRSPFLVGFMMLAILGIVLIGWGHNTGMKLTGVFFAITGTTCATPAVLAFMVNNIVGSAKRQAGIPLQLMFGGLGGVAPSLWFRNQDAPYYMPGLYASLTSFSMCAIGTGLMALYYRNQNRKADKYGIILEGLEGFRYTL
ncbi:hypothetical protein VF21_06798 [Pseudogymnoascus sp. 05NY08]|nr:hypothetical protein VF21_06798 [Pseudogymnoascus sp. 05NY08]